MSNPRWHYRNVILIGDALRTVHFSIGSGTRMALEDAIALYKACAAHDGDIESALMEFESVRKSIGDELLAVAWYENFRELMHLDPIAFADSYMTRGGKVDLERLRQRAPEFVAAYEASQE